MPFTLLHLGPALTIGIPLRRHIHLPTFIIASIIIDVEPLIVIATSVDYPLHGYLHTFLLAVILGLILGFLIYRLDKVLARLWSLILMEPAKELSMKSTMASGTLGTLIHVLLDSPLYEDIRPLFPLSINPLYNPGISYLIHEVCIAMCVIGLLMYLYIIIKIRYSAGLYLVGFTYIALALTLTYMYARGVHDISPTLLIVTPMIIGLLYISLAIQVSKLRYRLFIPTLAANTLILTLWLLIIILRIINLDLLTRTFIYVFTFPITSHILLFLAYFERGRRIKVTTL